MTMRTINFMNTVRQPLFLKEALMKRNCCDTGLSQLEQYNRPTLVLFNSDTKKK